MNGDRRTYLDHAATSPLREEARTAMAPYLDAAFGNPSGAHAEARRARRAVDDAREEVAELLGCDFGEVVFTSGGTESDNLGIFGPRPEDSGPLVCTAMEHPAVLAACRARARESGACLREVPSDKDGIVDLAGLAEACTPETVLVSVMAVNNEVGSVQPLDEVAEVVRRRSPSAVLHTDAVQAVPWLGVAEHARGADLVSVSAHKFGGPKGIGALVVRDGRELRPLLFGGGQERERRSGTTNVAGVVGMAAALGASARDRSRAIGDVAARRDRLADGLVRAVPGLVETGDRATRTAAHLHVRISGIDSEALVLLLDEAGVAVSAGSSCSSGATEPSHVLLAMGLDPAQARSGIRFSLGLGTTEAEIDHALAVTPDAVARLRG